MEWDRMVVVQKWSMLDIRRDTWERSTLRRIKTGRTINRQLKALLTIYHYEVQS